MRRYLIILFLISQILANAAVNWGPTGHRVIGEVAEQHLTHRAKKHIMEILGGKSLALVSTYADEIKSDPRFKGYGPWHYVNIATEARYAEVPPSPEGDLVMAIEKCREVLKNKASSGADKEFYLKLLIHFIGDLHQPLHVGRSEDKGGNDIQLRWFTEGSNLHRVWDSNMIDSYGMSYTELAGNLPVTGRREVKQIQSGSLLDWISESQMLAAKVYLSAETGEKLSYGYMYDNFGIVKEQLLKGGLRLAGILNELF